MKIYCVKCKRKTPSLNIRTATTKNNESVVKGERKICSTSKNCFTKSKAGGKLDVHSLIGKLPKPKAGWTPTNYKYMGPLYPVDKQLEYNPETGEITKWIVPPFNKVDEISAHQDVCYSRGVDKNDCDKKWFLNWTRFLMVSCQKWACLLEKLSTPNKNLV